MFTAIRQKTVVGKGGKVEFLSPELTAGSVIEVIVLIEADEQDATDYLLSTEANRKHLYEALEELEKRDNYVYVDIEKL